MEAKLTELEKAVNRAVRRLAELQKPSSEAPTSRKRKDSSPDTTATLSQSLSDLSAENRRLRQERKDLRKRVRAIIKTIDQVKW